MLPKTNAFVKGSDGQTKWMCFDWTWKHIEKVKYYLG